MTRRSKISHDVRKFFGPLRAVLEGHRLVRFAYVFGSHGKGHPGPLSDADVAAFLDNKTEDFLEERSNLIEKVTRTLGTDGVDLVVLNTAPLPLRFEVTRTGNILLSRDDDERVDFEARTFDSYCDAEPLRKMFWNSLVARLREDRFGRQ